MISQGCGFSLFWWQVVSLTISLTPVRLQISRVLWRDLRATIDLNRLLCCEGKDGTFPPIVFPTRGGPWCHLVSHDSALCLIWQFDKTIVETKYFYTCLPRVSEGQAFLVEFSLVNHDYCCLWQFFVEFFFFRYCMLAPCLVLVWSFKSIATFPLLEMLHLPRN